MPKDSGRKFENVFPINMMSCTQNPTEGPSINGLMAVGGILVCITKNDALKKHTNGEGGRNALTQAGD